jgi:hypothetical protein
LVFDMVGQATDPKATLAALPEAMAAAATAGNLEYIVVRP